MRTGFLIKQLPARTRGQLSSRAVRLWCRASQRCRLRTVGRVVSDPQGSAEVSRAVWRERDVDVACCTHRQRVSASARRDDELARVASRKPDRVDIQDRASGVGQNERLRRTGRTTRNGSEVPGRRAERDPSLYASSSQRDHLRTRDIRIRDGQSPGQDARRRWREDDVMRQLLPGARLPPQLFLSEKFGLQEKPVKVSVVDPTFAIVTC